jgi:hypothetical protein
LPKRLTETSKYFFCEIDSFEEIPLISRDSRLAKLQKMLKQDDASEFLLGLAYFLLNTIRLIGRSKNIKYGLLAITYVDFDEREYGPTLRPHLFFYPDEPGQKLYDTLLKKQPPNDSTEMLHIKSTFKSCNLLEQFIFIESRWFDEACKEELIRIFAIPKQS